MSSNVNPATIEAIGWYVTVFGLIGSLVFAIITANQIGSYRRNGFAIVQVDQASLADRQPAQSFEVATLSDYYRHALARTNFSFYVSLTFAAFGFVFIALGSFWSADIGSAVAKLAGGSVVEAVAGLFFVQSTSSQKSMSEFFDKLRVDRRLAEARELLDETEDADRRDDLRAELVKLYSGSSTLRQLGIERV